MIRDFAERAMEKPAMQKLVKLLDENPQAFAEMLKTEDRATVSTALDVLRAGKNDKRNTQLLIDAMKNPNPGVRDLASQTFKETGLHVGLVSMFDPAKPDAADVGRAIVICEPVIPENVASYYRHNVDPVVAATIINKRPRTNAREGEVSAEDLARYNEIRQNLPPSLTEQEGKTLEKAHERNVEERRIRIVASAVAALMNLTPDAQEVIDKTERLIAELKRRKINPEELHVVPATTFREIVVTAGLPGDPESMRRLRDAIGGKHAERNGIRREEVLAILIRMQRTDLYGEYLGILADPDLTPEQRVEKENVFFIKVIGIEELRPDDKREFTQYIQRRFIADQTAIDRQEAPGSSLSLSQGVTASALTAAILTPEKSENPQLRDIIGRQVSPEILEEIRKGKILEGDDTTTLTVALQNKQVMRLSMASGGNLRATVRADDGQEFLLETIDVATLDRTVAFRVIPHEILRHVLNGEENDAQILEAVFGQNMGDEKLNEKTNLERMAAYETGMIRDSRRESIALFRDLGVLNGTTINAKRARLTQDLFRFLDVRMGLQYVHERDLHEIAESWKKDEERQKTPRLRTPMEARRMLGIA